MSVKSIWWEGVQPDPARLNALSSDSLSGLLGIEVSAVGDDWIEARMPVDQRTRQPLGRLHGGASVVLAESIGSLGAAFTVDRERFVAVGMEINANHVRPARDGWVTAVARPEAMGRTSQVWTIRISDEEGRLVCISRFTVAIIARDRH